MRVAVWTPLPPTASGIADYNFVLLAEMARDRRHRFTAVVSPQDSESLAPVGVTVVSSLEYRPEDYDVNLYHLGNRPDTLAYMLPHALARPGVLVLHDPAIVDSVEVILGGRDRRIFELEVAYNLGCSEDDERVDTAIAAWERTDLLLSRRWVEASPTTLVHSRWAADHLRERFGEVDVRVVPHAVVVDAARDARTSPTLTFGAFGSLGFHKRLPQVIEAFAAARRAGLDARLLVAGRRDHLATEQRVARLIDELGLADVVDFEVDVSAERLEACQGRCDVLVGLRWPTAGETSGPLLKCFARGCCAIVSDIPQNEDFSSDFCRRVTLDPAHEHDELVAAMLEAARDVAATRAAGALAREVVAAECSLEIVARQYLEHLERVASQVTEHRRPVPGLGVNAIASWAAATGLAEAGRRAALALHDEGVALSLQDVNIWAKVDFSRIPEVLANLPQGNPYRINLSFLNINEFHVVDAATLRRRPEDYLIAMWYWELPALPAYMVPEIEQVDEIWVASAFVRDVFLRYTDKPVHVIPAVVQPVADLSLSRGDLGLPEDATIYLVTFDANSTIARKNPYGAIKAFERAFGRSRQDVVLVVKVINLERFPVVQRDLRTHVARLGGIMIERDMAPGEIAALIRHCDVYVSMHRSEGFGLGLAEAMYFARPVVATANSGNLDFMNAANSCLVSYRSMVVHRNEMVDNAEAMVVYEPGNLWVDPDLDHAAQLMRWLFENPAARERIGARAARDITEGFSLAAAGRAMRLRLAQVQALMDEGWRRSEPPDLSPTLTSGATS